MLGAGQIRSLRPPPARASVPRGAYAECHGGEPDDALRGALVLLQTGLAGVVALLTVLGAACLAAPPAPTPEVPFSPEDQPSVAAGSAAPLGQPERVRVIGAGTEGVNLRAQPGATGARLKGLFDGTELELIGPDRSVDGMTWRHVRDPADRTEGWVVADFVAPVTASSAPSPPPTPSR